MTFWNNIGENALEPKRNYRFRLEDGETTGWWWAKTVDKPSFEVSNNEYQLINHKFKFPGITTWKPISITAADIGDVSNLLIDELRDFGYRNPNDDEGMVGLEKVLDNGSIANNMSIQQLDADGNTIETWTLRGAFITSISFSKLDYSNDDITEITIEVAYDYADFE